MGVAGRCVGGPGSVGRLSCRGASSPLLVLRMPMLLQVLYRVLPRVRALCMVLLWLLLMMLRVAVAEGALLVVLLLTLVLRALRVMLRFTVSLVLMMMRVLLVVLVWVRMWAASGLCSGVGRLCSRVGAWGAAQPVQLGDLLALETEVSGWTELAGWRCVNFTNNPGNMRRALGEEETAAYHVLLASFVRSLFVPRKSPVTCAVQKFDIPVNSGRELHSKVERLLQEASGSSVAAARQGDTPSGATEDAQVVARRADTQNGATKGA